VATGVTAYNYTCKEADSDFMTFTIYFSGFFDESNIYFEAIGHYAGEPMMFPLNGANGDVKMGGRLDTVALTLKEVSE
jgi:hypothetical protein